MTLAQMQKILLFTFLKLLLSITFTSNLNLFPFTITCSLILVFTKVSNDSQTADSSNRT